MTPDELAQACAETMWSEDQATRSLGATLDHVAPGSARLSLEVAPHMVNGHGICHGGYIFTLADSAFAFACNTRNRRAVAAHCAITYLRPARLGARLTATATERTRAGRSGITDVTVTDDQGAIIAEFRGTSRELGPKFLEDQS
jgi:acyl-CoA thioesterase